MFPDTSRDSPGRQDRRFEDALDGRVARGTGRVNSDVAALATGCAPVATFDDAPAQSESELQSERLIADTVVSVPEATASSVTDLARNCRDG